MSDVLSKEQKMKNSLYYFLLGKGWFEAAEIMTYAAEFHNGVRKDGITPEFGHQIWIANFIRTLNLPDEVAKICISIAFLHDTSEDKSVGFEEIEARWGHTIADGVKRMTKKYRGNVIPEQTYFDELSLNLYASIVKGADRLHNISTMLGAFTHEKMLRYINESERCHLPMLKKARRRFPQHEHAFENIKQSLNGRIELYKVIVHQQTVTIA